MALESTAFRALQAAAQNLQNSQNSGTAPSPSLTVNLSQTTVGLDVRYNMAIADNPFVKMSVTHSAVHRLPQLSKEEQLANLNGMFHDIQKDGYAHIANLTGFTGFCKSIDEQRKVFDFNNRPYETSDQGGGLPVDIPHLTQALIKHFGLDRELFYYYFGRLRKCTITAVMLNRPLKTQLDLHQDGVALHMIVPLELEEGDTTHPTQMIPKSQEPAFLEVCTEVLSEMEKNPTHKAWLKTAGLTVDNIFKLIGKFDNTVEPWMREEFMAKLSGRFKENPKKYQAFLQALTPPLKNDSMKVIVFAGENVKDLCFPDGVSITAKQHFSNLTPLIHQTPVKEPENPGEEITKNRWVLSLKVVPDCCS